MIQMEIDQEAEFRNFHPAASMNLGQELLQYETDFFSFAEIRWRKTEIVLLTNYSVIQ